MFGFGCVWFCLDCFDLGLLWVLGIGVDGCGLNDLPLCGLIVWGV